MIDYEFQEETFALRGCMMNVYNELGSGFLEKVYHEALEIEFINAGIPYRREVVLNIQYKGHVLNQQYVTDFVCYDKIIVEVKSIAHMEKIHDAQVLNYLKATGYKVGMLVNFGEPELNIKRLYNFMDTKYNNRIH